MPYIKKYVFPTAFVLGLWALLVACEPNKVVVEPTENCAIEKVFSGTDSILMRHEFANNRLSKTFLYNNNQNYIGYKTYDYASRTRIIVKEYSPTGTLLWLTTANLDDLGNVLTEVRERFGKPKSYHQATAYNYDGEGFLSKSTLRFAADPQNAVPTTYTTITKNYLVSEGQVELLRTTSETISPRDTLIEVLREVMDYSEGVNPKTFISMPYKFGKQWTALPSQIEAFYGKSDSAAFAQKIFYELDDNGYLKVRRTRTSEASGRTTNAAELYQYKCGLE